MFPTFISILDIQSWWEVPSIAHFCSLFRSAFNLLDFDIEDLEEALLTDGTEETSWLQELIVRLLSGCLPSNEISTFNYQMFLRRLFRQKCQEHDRYNPFNTDIDFQLLPLRTKVDILQCLCDFRLDAEDVLDQLKNLEADSLRVVPLGYDSNDSAYWYFYGTRLYREDFKTKNNKKKSIWQVICFTEDDWFQLTKKFNKSSSKTEKQLYHTLSENFLPELPRLFKEKERLARKRLLENQPRRTSSRLKKDIEAEEKAAPKEPLNEEVEKSKKEKEKKELERKRRDEAYERRAKLKQQSEDSQSELSESRYEMAGNKSKKSKPRARKNSDCSNSDKDTSPAKGSKRNKKSVKEEQEMPAKTAAKPATVGRQTNNSLSAATGQIVIQSNVPTTTNKKKLKTSQVFRQTDEDLQTGMHKILDFVKNHDDAWPFADPVEEEYAPNYYSIIRKPMDLQKMEERLDSGFYKSYSKFKADFQLIVNNCRLYNGAENEYTGMVDNLLKVFESATDKYLDQISSSDDEIAVEYFDTESDSKGSKKKKGDSESEVVKKSKRKPMLAAQPNKKKNRSLSEDSMLSRSSSFESLHDVKPSKPKKSEEKEKESKKVAKNSAKAKKVTPKKVEKENKKRARSLSLSSVSEKDPYESFEDEEDEFIPTKTTKKSQEKTKKHAKKASKKDKTEGKKNKTESKKEKSEGKKTEKEPKEKHLKEKEKKSPVKEPESKSKTKQKNITKEDKPEKKTKKEAKEPEKKSKDVKKKEEKKGKTKKAKKESPIRRRSFSRSFSRSPPRSNISSPPPSWPPSDPESPVEVSPKKSQKRRRSDDFKDEEVSAKQKKQNKLKHLFEEEKPVKHVDKKLKKEHLSSSPAPLSPKPKDKHNKLRETIEKLKAKSEISNKIKTSEYDFIDDLSKEANEKSKEDKTKPKVKEKSKSSKKDLDLDDGNSTMDSTVSENRKSSKKKSSVPPPIANTNETKNIEIEALTLATEQTLKDINKWLDDTPKFSEFSSASNSPSYTGLDDFDTLNAKIDDPNKKKMDKPLGVIKKDGLLKDGKKRVFRDPTKLFNKRREIQRTIERLQPGKSKGNLITNAPKVDELFPMGPLSKIKDTKNSLIVKTDTNAPKLSLGSVLDSFGKHKFVDDQKKEEEEKKVEVKEVTEATPPVLQDSNTIEEKEKKEVKKPVEPAKEEVITQDDGGGGATPNLSAWFKAFGAPKMAPPPVSSVKKCEIKPDGKENEEKPAQKVPIPDPSPNLDSPVQGGGASVPRQRRISTGSSMSERSSFSQDMDSPRVGIDERLAYPAPYPSPMHRSPSGQSPIMASPRPDVSPKSAAYPPFNGQMRVGFYQDTVSTKSSPDKSCSPRDNPQSPYLQYSEHVYSPNTTQNANYSYANSPYYTHPPNYSSTNPTPPYNTEASSASYYDTSKSLTDQYQAKTVPNYSANSPASNLSSPASHPQHSPSLHSPSVPSPSVHSPHSLHIANVNSPSMHSPSMQSPSMQSPSMHSPSMHSPEPVKIAEKPIQQPPIQTPVFPVKKRAYAEVEQQQQQQQNLLRYPPQMQSQEEIINRNLQMGEQLNLGANSLMDVQKSQLQQEKDLSNKPQHDPYKQVAQQQQQLQQQQQTQQQPQPAPIQQQPTQKQPLQTQPELRNYTNPTPTTNPYYSGEGSYPLNIPSGRSLGVAQQELERKIDLSKYTNMGYSGPDVNFGRNIQQQYSRPPEYPRSAGAQQTAEQIQTSQANEMLRYSNPNVLTQGYKSHETSAPEAHSNAYATSQSLQSQRVNDSVSAASRLAPQQQQQEAPTNAYKSAEVTIPKPTYNAPSIGSNIANLSHIVDRYGNDERMLSGLQSSTGPYYSDKGLSTSHMFNKPISSNTSALPMFSQANISSMQSQYQNMQATSAASMFNRQINELQNQSMMNSAVDVKAQQAAAAAANAAASQAKKAKKPKYRKTATPTLTEQSQSAANQGFQSYAGLKSQTSSIEPGAISLKTSSVVPGSAFNFGSAAAAAGLGIAPGLYGDKDSYPNFLDDFGRAPSNYYMAAAAAAHHRTTPESNDKQTRAHHSSSTAQGGAYPFLGAPQVRPGYPPIGGPFMAPGAQAQLMDTSSPIYQHYLQAGVLNHQAAMLGPPGAYPPPGYHPALSMRQQYDPMTRPSWL